MQVDLLEFCLLTVVTLLGHTSGEASHQRMAGHQWPVLDVHTAVEGAPTVTADTSVPGALLGVGGGGVPSAHLTEHVPESPKRCEDHSTSPCCPARMRTGATSHGHLPLLE